MTGIRTDLPPLPQRMAKLPLDARGYPVPWFVAWVDGAPDFRVIGPGKVATAIKRNVCWLCGEPLGVYRAFVIGPMCAINRISSEPPSHRECAEFAARACPFLTRPLAKRNDRDIPEEAQDPAGQMIMRNPGVTLLWITKAGKPFRADGGVLFNVGEPTETLWFCQGRPATREEVMHSIDTGLPILEAAAVQDGPTALRELAARQAQAERLLPREATTLGGTL